MATCKLVHAGCLQDVLGEAINFGVDHGSAALDVLQTTR